MIELKKGDSFIATCVYTVDGTAASIDDIEIYSQIRWKGGKVLSDLTVTKIPEETGKFILTSETNNWPEKKEVLWNIKYVENGVIYSTTTVEILVLQQVTQIPGD